MQCGPYSHTPATCAQQFLSFEMQETAFAQSWRSCICTVKPKPTCAVTNLALAAAPGEEGEEEITPMLAEVSHSQQRPQLVQKPMHRTKPPAGMIYLQKRVYFYPCFCKVVFPLEKPPFPAALACPGFEGLLETVSPVLAAAPAYK